MRRIELFKQALNEKRALKVISGINNLNVEKAEMVISSAIEAKATAVDVAANREILSLARLIKQMGTQIVM